MALVFPSIRREELLIVYIFLIRLQNNLHFFNPRQIVNYFGFIFVLFAYINSFSLRTIMLKNFNEAMHHFKSDPACPQTAALTLPSFPQKYLAPCPLKSH